MDKKKTKQYDFAFASSRYNVLEVKLTKKNEDAYLSPITLATMLRRIILSNVPTLAISYYNDDKHDKIYIVENSTCMHNGMIKHRLSSTPFNILPDDTKNYRVTYKSAGPGIISTQDFTIQINEQHQKSKECIPDIYFHKIRSDAEELEFQASLEMSCGDLSGCHTPCAAISAIPLLKERKESARLSLETIEDITNYTPDIVVGKACIIAIEMIDILYQEISQAVFEPMKWNSDDTNYSAFKTKIGGEDAIDRSRSKFTSTNKELLASKIRSLSTIVQVLQEYIVKSDETFLHISYTLPHPLKRDVNLAVAFQKATEEEAKQKLLASTMHLKTFLESSLSELVHIKY